jgi:hypothetical protein
MAQQYIDVSSGSYFYYTGSNAPAGGIHKLLTFRSLQHLYYSGFNTGSGTIESSSAYYNYVETSFTSGSRKMLRSGPADIPGEIVLFSIPRKYYGTNIEPGSLIISSSNPSTIITDDGEGNLVSGSIHVGNIIYSHGQLIINTLPFITYFSQNPTPGISFKGNTDIKTSVFNITVSDYELNHTLNPTAQSGSIVMFYSSSSYVQPSGIYADNVTGSAFQPYITTVGLYNDSDQLIAVAKLAQPLPKPADTELTIQVKLDV